MAKRKKKSNNTTPQKDFITELPLQIIAEILSRLAVKSLLKLKCVSKPWCSLISSPEFSKVHLKRALENTDSHRLLLSYDPFQSVDPEKLCDDGNKDTVATHLCYPSRFEDFDAELNILTTEINSRLGMPLSSYKFIGSCNGLICALFGRNQFYVSNPTTRGRSNKFFVFNPTTRESRELPMLPIKDNIMFDGFGYDSQLDDYKLVVGTHGGEVSIFSLKGNTWRTIQGLKVAVRWKPAGSGIFLNCALHWLYRGNNDIGYQTVLVRFDLVQEKFLDQIPLPDHIDFFFGELNVIGNCLCVFTMIYEQVWVMKEYGNNNSWNKVCDILPERKSCRLLQWITKNGKIVFDRDGRYLDVYDPIQGSAKQIWIPNDRHWGWSIIYLESLISPRQ